MVDNAEPRPGGRIAGQVNRHTYRQLPRHSLIVCASLVEHPANLGALCRTVEAFRLEALVIRDLAIAQTTAFRGLAASAHHWQPLQACPIEQLPQWLTAIQHYGYTALALENSDRALPLDQFTYPERSVLVLGQELTGIPTQVRAYCGQAVQIPQYGLVESLNVQTAAAIAIYEYIRQYRDRQPQ